MLCASPNQLWVYVLRVDFAFILNRQCVMSYHDAQTGLTSLKLPVVFDDHNHCSEVGFPLLSHQQHWHGCCLYLARLCHIVLPETHILQRRIWSNTTVKHMKKKILPNSGLIYQNYNMARCGTL